MSRLKGVLASVTVLLFIGIIAFFVEDMGVDAYNNKHINPAIYDAFNEIEAHCMGFSEMERPMKCQYVLKQLDRCTNSREPCSAEDYYNNLKRWGFQLPSYYKPGFQPKVSILDGMLRRVGQALN